MAPTVVGEDVVARSRFNPLKKLRSMMKISPLQTRDQRIAIQNSNLPQAERRSRLLKAANRVVEVTSILDLDNCSATVNIICESYGLYYAGVFPVDEANEYLLCVPTWKAGKAMVADGHKLKSHNR
jgi:hypothetical protein